MSSFEEFKKEKIRHNNRLEEILKNSDIGKIKELIKENNKLESDIKHQRDMFTLKFYPVVDHIIRDEKEDRVVINDNLTIRDGSVYQYKKSKEARFGSFVEEFKNICEYDNTGKMENLEDLFLDMTYSDIIVYLGEDYYIVEEPMYINEIYFLDKENIDNKKDLNNLMDNFESNFKRYNIENIKDNFNNENFLESIFKAEKDIKDAAEKRNKKLKDKKEMEKRNFEKIKDRLSRDFSLVALKNV